MPLRSWAKQNVLKVVKCLRTISCKIRRLRLKNKTPSIIANNCIGTFMCRDMGVRFNTPTINLFIKNLDFVKFTTHLAEYLESDVEEVKDTKLTYPVGKIRYMDDEVRIYFIHYKTFEEARSKWNERKRRVNFDNLYIVQQFLDASVEDIHNFDRIPHKNKLLITSKNLTNSANVVELALCNGKTYQPGEILLYKGAFALRRHMDDIDYISFLNRP